MKTIQILLVTAMLLLPGTVFSQTTETRKLPSFARLEVDGSFNTIIEEGGDESVKIKSEGIDPQKILTDVKGDLLKIHLEKGNYRNVNATVYLTYKTLKSISASGSGNLTCQSGLPAAAFSLSASGSGNITVNKSIKAQRLSVSTSGSGKVQLAALEATDLHLSLSGSGDIYISSGQVKTQSISMSGSGSARMFGLKSDNCSLSSSGSSSVEITVEQSLELMVSGSGNIKYQGNAQITKSSTSGSVEIKKVN